MFLRFRPAIALLFFLIILLPITAQTSSVSKTGNSFWNNVHLAGLGSIFFWAADNGRQDADPSPILPSMGFSAAWQFNSFFRLEFTEDIYFTNYEYNSTLGYAMACNPENRSAFVLGLLTGLQITYFLPLGSNGTIWRIYVGPAADFRIITLAIGLHPDDFTGDIKTDAKLQTDAIRSYFLDKGRWFFPVIGTGVDFPLNNKFLLGLDFRTWFPLYRTWTDKNLPNIDGWRFGASIRITSMKNN